MKFMGAVFVSVVILGVSQSLAAATTTWCLKVVDDGEMPIAGVQVYWRDASNPDWQTVSGLIGLGRNQDGGGFQTVAETVSDLRDSGARDFLRLQLNYFFRTRARESHGYLKIAHPSYQPVELQVPFPNEYKWDRVELRRRDEGHGRNQRGSREQDRMPDAILAVTVLAENDQRTPQDDRPLAGAVIRVTIEASGQQYEATTNGNGEAVLPVPMPGRATVEILCDGYRPKHWRTNLESGRTERQRITLLTTRERR